MRVPSPLSEPWHGSGVGLGILGAGAQTVKSRLDVFSMAVFSEGSGALLSKPGPP